MAPAPKKAERDRREEWKEILEEKDWPLFNALRDWRNGQAKEEGIPPYVICRNRQLAEIARRRPTSLSKLAVIEKLGKAKIQRYGAAILGLAARGAPAATSGEGETDEQPEQE